MANEELMSSEELLKRADAERDAMIAQDRRAFEEQNAAVEAERENPLNRKKLIRFILDHGGLSKKKVAEAHGGEEADNLWKRIRNPRFWKKNG